MSPQQIAVLIVAATLGVLVLLLVLYGRPRRTREEPLPANFSAGDPDSVLEGSRLQKSLIWGVAGAIFITGFLAIYFVIEPFRQAAYSERFLEASVHRGEESFIENCAPCHGPEGEGGFAATDPSWPAPPLNNAFYRYAEEDITRIIESGRENTPMPPWSIEFGGPLNDQKVEDIVNFLISIQVEEGAQFELDASVTEGTEVFAQKCAVCHGESAEGQAMGQPLPTYYAADLTTAFYRLGLKVMRVEVQDQLRAENEGQDPSPAEVEAALAAVPAAEVIAAGEEPVRETIGSGRRPTPMPQWENRILPEQIDAVIEFLRSIQTVPS